MTVTDTRIDKLDQLHGRLSAEILGLISGADWQAMLAVASRFHRYRTGTRRYSKAPNGMFAVASRKLTEGGVGPCHISWVVRFGSYGRVGYLPWRDGAAQI